MTKPAEAEEGSIESRLIEAARAGLVHEVANALARGANIQSYDRFGCNALHWAANNGLRECAKYLLDAGARVDEPVNKRLTNSANSTPLSLAIFSGSEETVELLLSRGAQPNGLESSSSRPLALAVSGSEGRMLPILLAWGADPNGVDKKSGTSALMLAAEGERYALMELLIAAGALLDLKDAQGRDAHERAMAKGCEGSAAWLKGRASAMLERDEISKKLGDPAGAKAGVASRL